jgi:hypothetical protein
MPRSADLRPCSFISGRRDVLTPRKFQDPSSQQKLPLKFSLIGLVYKLRGVCNFRSTGSMSCIGNRPELGSAAKDVKARRGCRRLNTRNFEEKSISNFRREQEELFVLRHLLVAVRAISLSTLKT